MTTRTFGDDEQFMEDWLRFSLFHRTRNGLGAFYSLRDPDDGIAMSAMLLIMQEWLAAHEDFGIWADALRLHGKGYALVDAMDKAKLDWKTFFPELEQADADSYGRMFKLAPIGAVPEEARAQYEGALEAWSDMARAAARNLNIETQMKRQLLYRLLNKIKHGLLVSGARAPSGERRLYFYAEAGSAPPRDVWSQRVSPSSGAHFVRETFAISRLLAATLDAYFIQSYKREPDVPWRDGLNVSSVDRSLLSIKAIAGLPTGPTYQS